MIIMTLILISTTLECGGLDSRWVATRGDDQDRGSRVGRSEKEVGLVDQRERGSCEFLQDSNLPLGKDYRPPPTTIYNRGQAYSAKLIYCLKSCSWCTRESSQAWNSNLSKDKIRFWSLPSSSSQLDSQVPLSPALSDDRRRSWKTQSSSFFQYIFSKRRKRWCRSHFPDKFQAFGKFWLNQELFGLVKLTCRVCLVRLGDRDDSHHYVGFTSAGHCTHVSFSTHIHRKKL